MVFSEFLKHRTDCEPLIYSFEGLYYAYTMIIITDGKVSNELFKKRKRVFISFPKAFTTHQLTARGE